MANYDLGTAHGQVVIDYDDKGLKKSQTDLDNVKQKGLSTGQALDKASRTMGRAGLAVAAGIGLAVKATADFEKSISAIGAVTGATGDQLNSVRDKALQLGRDTKFSASEAADAMGELAKAGVSLPDIMNGAADATVALAAAGGVALPEAATLASNAMNAFQLQAKDMPKVADLIAGAANASAIDVHDFGLSLQQAGAVAHSTGLSLQETSVAIAVLGNAGIKGSDAGTSLKQMLIQLANPTDKAAKLMKQLGFSAFDANGNLKPLDAIAQNLQTSMKDMTPQARNAALAIIFGSDAARAGAVFFQNGAAGIDKMAAAMNKVKAADVAKARMDNLSGSVEQLKGSIETASIKFGEMGQGPLRSLIDSITKLVNSFTNLSDGTQQTILVLVASLGGLALFGAGLIKTVRYTQELIAVMKTLKIIAGAQAVFRGIATGVELLNGSLSTLAANPIVLIIAAIVVAVALLTIGIIELWKHSETFRSIVIGVWNAVKDIVGAVADFCVSAWHVMEKGIDGLMVAVRGVKTAWDAVWSALAPIVSVTFAIITGVINVAIAIIKSVIIAGLAVIKAAWSVWLFFAPIVQAVMNLIIAIVKLAIAIIRLVITAALVILYQAWKLFWDSLSEGVKIAWDLITSIVQAAVDLITAIFNSVISAWTTVWNAVWAAIKAIVDTAFVQGIIGAIKSGLQFVFNLFGQLAKLAGIVGKYFKNVYDAVAGPIGSMLKLIGGIGGQIIGYFKNAGKWLLNAGKNIIIGLINGITSMINKLRGYLNNITSWISQWKGPPAKDKILLVDNGEDIMKGLIKGIQSRVPELEAMLQEIGPGNIATSVARSETVKAAISGTLANATAAVPISRASAQANQASTLIDHEAFVRALKDAGVGEISVELDGEKISRSTERSTGRRTNQRRRTS